MTENEIAPLTLDICFKIHRQYGPGLLESVYEQILCYELGKAAIPFTGQPAMLLVHDGIKMETGFRADVIMDDRVIVELKSVEALADIHLKIAYVFKSFEFKARVVDQFQCGIIKRQNSQNS